MSKTSEEATDFLFPLASRRTRTDTVAAELAEMGRLPVRQVVARAQETHPDRRLARETQVAVVRGFLRAENQKAADAVLAALIDHLRPVVKARAQQWSAVFPADVEDAVEDALLKLIGYIRAVDASQEFWECNFAHCLKLRLGGAFRHAAAQRRNTLSLTSEWADGTERTADTADPQGEMAFDDIETQEMLQALSQAVPGFAEYYFLHTRGYTDKEIAVQMDVTDRTLRNWKDRARTYMTTLRPRP